MKLHGRLMLVAALLLASACGDDDDVTTDTSEETAAKVAASLTSNVLFSDGVVELGEIPDSSNDTVSLKQEDQVLSLEPDTTEILALEVDNPDEEDDPIAATLMQFEGDDDHHVEVPLGKGGDGGTDAGASEGKIALKFKVDGDVCSKLCDDTFTITMVQAVKLSKGGVSKHLKRTIKLDCSKHGDHDQCAKSSGPSKAGTGGKSGGKDGGTSTGGRSGSGGATAANMDATLGGEFANNLAAANNFLCKNCAPFKGGSECSAMVPASAIACIKTVVTNNGGRADASNLLNTIAVTLSSAASACMACDYATCDPNYLKEQVEMLPDDLQDAFNGCAEDAGGMLGSSFDAAASP